MLLQSEDWAYRGFQLSMDYLCVVRTPLHCTHRRRMDGSAGYALGVVVVVVAQEERSLLEDGDQ